MRLAMIGLGRMGANMAERIRRAGHEVVGYDRNPDVSQVPSLEALESAVKIRVGTAELMSGTLVLPKKLSMPESSLFSRLRWVSLAITALSLRLTVTVRMSPT